MAESKKKPRGLLVARRGFMLPGGRTIKGGQIVASDDPAVKGRTELFDQADEVVEQATAAPGELRINKRRKPHASQKARERAVAEAAKED